MTPAFPITNQSLSCFRSLFKGREDVFAIHWQKKNKSGYMPAYWYDPYMYRRHKMKGGTFRDFKDKKYLPLTDEQLKKHLTGEKLIGIYPLLKDNTSWFIAADFDKENWVEESTTLIKACGDKGIPAYLERSRSGNGGHVWIFFDQAYPAFRSRYILTSILEETGIFSVFDKRASFDRLFPNQNFLSGKGLGNLIALPLHQPALKQGNSCFVDEKLQPYPDQFDFLASVERASTEHLDDIYQSLTNHAGSSSEDIKNNSSKLRITLDHAVHLNRAGIPRELINFLKEHLHFTNSEYFVKKNTGRNTWDTRRAFNLIEEKEDEVLIPSGFIGRLIRQCRALNINYEFADHRKRHAPVHFTSTVSLQDHQKKAVEAASKKDFGIITAPPGSGKTVMGLQIIAEKQQPALILVHRKQLLEQWVERTQAFFGIPKNQIGKIGQGKVKTGKAVTVAMIQSLGKAIERDTEITRSFGTLIIDECHHIPADSYRKIINRLAPCYQYGLTATPFRKGNDDKILFTHIGEHIAEIKSGEIKQHKRARIVVRNTSLDIPFNPKTDPFENLSRILVHDSARNKLICEDIAAELKNGRRAVVLTERKAHIHTLEQLLKGPFEVVSLSGDDTANSRKMKWKAIHVGNYQVLITTGQLFGEGTDVQNASCLFLAYPFSFKGKLIQYMGRVQRSEFTPVIYDYRDHKIDYLNRLFLKRNKYYRELEQQASLFDEEADAGTTRTTTIDKTVKVPVNSLDFRYGGIAFQCSISSSDTGLPRSLTFEVENEHARPEFDVLKPYFANFLGSKNIEATVHAAFQEGTLVSQEVHSKDLERINREMIESVRFRFVEKQVMGKKEGTGKQKSGLLSLQQLQYDDGDPTSLYNTEEELLHDILKNKKVRHFRQLKYLASRHEKDVLKIRFVREPFAFVFLLAGAEEYHVVLETLDTDEATYVWHVPKDRLAQQLQEIDRHLNVIRNKGRQAFLNDPPQNFSRILHDYSDEQKGFVCWKDMLEERLV